MDNVKFANSHNEKLDRTRVANLGISNREAMMKFDNQEMILFPLEKKKGKKNSFDRSKYQGAEERIQSWRRDETAKNGRVVKRYGSLEDL